MSQPYKKKLIEVAIPLEAINAASAREKSIRHGHPSTLHLWWARRPLAACRAILFAQLVDDPSSDPDQFPTEEAVDAERKRLFGIIEQLVIWENSTNEPLLEQAKAEILKCSNGVIPSVYDPFSGGCSIPSEAQRLGLPAFGSDLNPVAVMIGKAMIEIPPRFKGMEPIHPDGKERNHYRNAEGLAEDVSFYGSKIREQAFRRIGHLYPEVNLPKENGGGSATVIAWLWARTVTCPNPGCGCETPLLTTFVLSSKKGKEAFLIPRVSGREIRFDVSQQFDVGKLDANKGYKRGTSGIFECAFCGTSTSRDYVAHEGQAGRIGVMQTAVVCEGKRSRIYLPAECSPLPKNLPRTEKSHLKLALQPNPRDLWCRNFGAVRAEDLFSERQTIALNTFSDLVSEVRDTIERDAEKAGMVGDDTPLRKGGSGARAYSEAVSVFLAFGVNRSADFWSNMCVWANQPKNELVAHLFGRHAIPMAWDFGEVNPFSNSGGNFDKNLSYVCKGLAGLVGRSNGSVTQENASETVLDGPLVISTDPPYYDNIGYSDISDFFYVWLKKSIETVYPENFATIATPKSGELVALPYRHSGKDEAEHFFLKGMVDVFKNIYSQTSENYPVSIYYAFKQTEVSSEGTSSTGWATFLEALIRSGFSVVGTWPVRTERAGRMVASGTNALASSVVLVCRKKGADTEAVTRSEFMKALKRELPDAISDLQAANVSPADMPQSAIGPGMGVFSRYESVLEADDTPMSVKTALQLINRELDEFLSDIQGEFDAETRFTLTWFEQNGYATGEFGVANSIAQARGIAVESVKHAGIIESSAGTVRILKRDELLDNWEPANDSHLTIWECCQYLVRTLENEGEGAAALLIKKIGSDNAEAVKDLAYCLYDISSNKRNEAREATAYNALISVWSDLTRIAATIQDIRGDRQTSLDL